MAPLPVLRRMSRAHFIMRLVLPGAVVEIAQVIDFLAINRTGLCDRTCGIDATLHRARVYHGRPPVTGDTAGGELRFTPPAFREFQIHAAAKARGLNPRDVPVSDQNEAGHLSFEVFSTSPCTRKSAIDNW